MVRHRLCVLQRTSIFQIGGDAGRTERVIADPRFEVNRGRAALDHTIGVLLPHSLLLSGFAAGDAGGLNVLCAVVGQDSLNEAFLFPARGEQTD
jgi:hypothetical protein